MTTYFIYVSNVLMTPVVRIFTKDSLPGSIFFQESINKILSTIYCELLRMEKLHVTD